MTMDEAAPLASTPDFSVLKQHRLVAYLWRATTGALRRAGASAREPLCAIGYAEIVCFAKVDEPALTGVAQAAPDFDALLFGLGLEGYEVVAGRVEPHARVRRF